MTHSKYHDFIKITGIFYFIFAGLALLAFISTILLMNYIIPTIEHEITQQAERRQSYRNHDTHNHADHAAKQVTNDQAIKTPSQSNVKLDPEDELLIILSKYGIILAAIITFILFLAYLTAGFSFINHTRYNLCLTMGCISCFIFPLGTILGVCTFVLLLREPVQEIFANSKKENMKSYK